MKILMVCYFLTVFYCLGYVLRYQKRIEDEAPDWYKEFQLNKMYLMLVLKSFIPIFNIHKFNGIKYSVKCSKDEFSDMFEIIKNNL